MKKRILGLVLGLALPMVGMAADEVAAVKVVEIKATAHEIMIRAIREKQVLRFNYNGHARVVEPHAYGVNATGEVVLHAFQTEGDSSSRPPPGWRTFNVGLIEELAATNERFSQARAGYVPGEPPLETVWAVLEKTAG